MVLADKFDILLGKIRIVVPWVTEGDDYTIIREYSSLSWKCGMIPLTIVPVVFGDSGNWSEKFSIKGGPAN